MSDGGAVLRVHYAGESARNGRVVRLDKTDPARGDVLLRALADANVDLRIVAPFYYDRELEGWAPLRSESEVAGAPAEAMGGPPRIEVRLERRALSDRRPLPDAAQLRAALGACAVATVGGEGDAEPSSSSGANGYFGIGIYDSKTPENVGSLWRAAYQLGAAFIYTIGHRNAWEKSCDTYKSWRAIPAYRYDTWGAFSECAPYAAPWVAVEHGGTPLEDFEARRHIRSLPHSRATWHAPPAFDVCHPRPPRRSRSTPSAACTYSAPRTTACLRPSSARAPTSSQ